MFSGGSGRGGFLGKGAEGAAHGRHGAAEPQVREQPVLPLARRPHAGTLFNMKNFGFLSADEFLSFQLVFIISLVSFKAKLE